MKKVLLLSVMILFSITMFAQTNKGWKKISKKEVTGVSKFVERESFPAEFSLYQINIESLKLRLLSAPDRKVATKSNTIISLPNTDGKVERYNVFEFSNFDSDLQALYPNIRSYVGIGIDDKYAQVSLSLDPRGIQAMVFRAGKRNEFIELYSQDESVYAVYNSSRVKGKLPFTCSTVDHEIVTDLQANPNLLKSNKPVLKTFRLAMSCTAEYSNYFGATSAADSGLVLAAFNATLTRVNGVFEKDLAIHLNITANSTNVIYYDAATDPYSDSDIGAGYSLTWSDELEETLSKELGTDTYDIGHLFGASGGGGYAGCIGCVCSTGAEKGRGYTSPADTTPAGDNFDIDFVCHEIGHQLGANHTFSHYLDNEAVTVEPGSGSTIMGYAGITRKITEVQAHSDDYFTYRSILQIQMNLLSKNCTADSYIIHGTPVVNAGSDWTIPQGTPFKLDGSATDIGGGALTYCWEQNDAATANSIGDNSVVSLTKTTGPNFRSREPQAVSYRYMPKLSSVLNNTLTTDWESVSSIARTLNFTLTVRDNVAGGGQTNTDAMIVTVNETVGPFDVTSQNTDQLWDGGSLQTITWTVNGTTALVGSTNVDILLSTDDGQTFATTLASNVPNNGSYAITVPEVTAANCRVMVKPTGNIYYDINTKNIAIKAKATLATEGFGLTDFSLYPNPNNGNYTVQFSSKTSNDITITMHDLRGRQVFIKSFQNNGLFNQELSLNNASSGIYLVTIQDGNRKEVKKIVVE